MLEKGYTIPELLQPALPPVPSWFPLPPGWLWLGAFLLIVLALIALFQCARWRRNLWRRQALEALQQPHSVDGWLALIKRLLLIHHSRQQISALTTPQAILARVPLDDDLRQQLSTKYCQPDNHLDDHRTTRLRAQLTRWLMEVGDV